MTRKRLTISIAALAFALILSAGPASAATCKGVTTTQNGTPGNDVLDGGSGIDVINGLGGNDTISGKGANDWFR